MNAAQRERRMSLDSSQYSHHSSSSDSEYSHDDEIPKTVSKLKTGSLSPRNIIHDCVLHDDGNLICKTANISLDKDQYECCVCLTSMTDMIFKCNSKGISHNICGDCEWQLRRMKSGLQHTKTPQCPICKTEGLFKRNKSLQKKLRAVSLGCKNAQQGCPFRFFPWDDTRKDHYKACMYEPVNCVFCNQDIPGGRVNFVTHLMKSSADKKDAASDSSSSLIPPCQTIFHETSMVPDQANKTASFRLIRGQNSFAVNFNQGIVLCFLSPENTDNLCWKCYPISISPRHENAGNNRVYLHYFCEEEIEKYLEFEKKMGLHAQHLQKPMMKKLTLSVGRLFPSYFKNNTSKDDDDHEYDVHNKYLASSPCTPIQIGFIYGGQKDTEFYINRLKCRMYTLEESFKVGAIIDARDFTGKWFQAEIMEVVDMERKDVSKKARNDSHILEVRRAKIHYLGYSSKYDEWLNVDTDSHRIAHRGTFTTGPDLRAIRRHAHTRPHPRVYRIINERRSRVQSQRYDEDDEEESNDDHQ
jgi:hypothetical protein